MYCDSSTLVIFREGPHYYYKALLGKAGLRKFPFHGFPPRTRQSTSFLTCTNYRTCHGYFAHVIFRAAHITHNSLNGLIYTWSYQAVIKNCWMIKFPWLIIISSSGSQPSPLWISTHSVCATLPFFFSLQIQAASDWRNFGTISTINGPCTSFKFKHLTSSHFSYGWDETQWRVLSGLSSVW